MFNTAPFVRLTDKISFVIGTLLIVSFNFFLGRYPDDFIYTFTSVLLPVLITIRIAYYYSLGWHYYITDFCYFANFLLLVFITWAPKSEILFKVVYLASQGALAAAIKAFRNSLVFHKIDMLTSLAIHAIPMSLMWHTRWFTIPK